MKSRQVTIVADDSIRDSSGTTNMAMLLTVGMMFLCYPLAWILLLHNYEREEFDPSSTGITWLIQIVAYWILDIVPLIANGGLAIFLAVFCFVVGTLKFQDKME